MICADARKTSWSTSAVLLLWANGSLCDEQEVLRSMLAGSKCQTKAQQDYAS